MSIKTQKLLRFIPLINLFTVFCWICLCLKKRVSVTMNIKYLLLWFGTAILVTIPEILIDKFCGIHIFVVITDYISMYVHMFIISHIAVKAQEKILENNK